MPKAQEPAPEYVPAEFRRQWEEVYKSAYARAKQDGKSDEDAESSAFAQANGVIKKRKGGAAMSSEGEKQGSEGHGGYLVTVDGKGHLPTHRNGKPDHHLMGAAWAALHGGYRGNKYEGPNKAEAIAKLRALYKSQGLDLPSETASEEPRQVFPIELSEAGKASRNPVAITGAWYRAGKKFEITLQHLYEMMANFAKRPDGRVNLDFEHASEDPAVAQGKEVPSGGDLVGLEEPEPYTDPKGGAHHILYGRYEFNDHARQLIREKKVKGISPAIEPDGEDRMTGKRQGATLSSIALTNRPFLFEMPLLALSEDGWKLMSAGAVHIDTNISSPQSAGEKGGNLKTYKVKKLADGEHKGKHGVYDGEQMMGLAEIEPDADDQKKASEMFLTEVGAPGKTLAEVKAIVESRKAETNEAALLSECVTEAGKIDRQKFGALLDSGKLKPSASLRATDAETRVAGKFPQGAIEPKKRQAALRLLLSDPVAFEALIAGSQPFVDLKEQGLAGGSTGAGAAQQLLDQAITAKMSEVKAAKPGLPLDRCREEAEYLLIQTERGQELWEAARKERLAEQAAEKQDR